MLNRSHGCDATLKIACSGCCPGVVVLWIHRGCWGILARWSGRVRGFGGLVGCEDSERSGHQICSLWRAFAEGYGVPACVGARELVSALRRRRLWCFWEVTWVKVNKPRRAQVCHDSHPGMINLLARRSR